MQGRQREVARIRKANRAAAVGRLMLGEIKHWGEFLEPDRMELEELPRKRLKAGHEDARRNVSKRIRDWCAWNFVNMNEKTLSIMYEDIKAYRGLEIPLTDFEEKYSEIRPSALKGAPKHATVVISLWGLQFMYPEGYLAKDVLEALMYARAAVDELKQYEKASQREAERSRSQIASLISRKQYASRTCVLCCFGLVEAYLNGIAWEFAKDTDRMAILSKKKRELIMDAGRVSIRDKLTRYPEIIAGRALWTDGIDPVKSFLEETKVFRDSLVHPSPFSVPEKFGGYDKLLRLYRLDVEIAERAASLSCEIIAAVNVHLSGARSGVPVWLEDLKKELKDGSNHGSR